MLRYDLINSWNFLFCFVSVWIWLRQSYIFITSCFLSMFDHVERISSLRKTNWRKRTNRGQSKDHGVVGVQKMNRLNWRKWSLRPSQCFSLQFPPSNFRCHSRRILSRIVSLSVHSYMMGETKLRGRTSARIMMTTTVSMCVPSVCVRVLACVFGANQDPRRVNIYDTNDWCDWPRPTGTFNERVELRNQNVHIARCSYQHMFAVGQVYPRTGRPCYVVADVVHHHHTTTTTTIIIIITPAVHWIDSTRLHLTFQWMRPLRLMPSCVCAQCATRHQFNNNQQYLQPYLPTHIHIHSISIFNWVKLLNLSRNLYYFRSMDGLYYIRIDCINSILSSMENF